MTSVTASIAKVGGNILLSRVLGFVRDLVIARLFGADAGTDAFFVAFKLPNLFRRLFAEGGFSMAFVPVLSQYREKGDQLALKRFIDGVAGLVMVTCSGITLLGVLGAPLMILIFAPGFADDVTQRELAATMFRLTFPYLFFISLTALAGAILNTYGRFGVPSFTPALLNLVLIGCALWLAPWMDQPIMALAWGVLIAGVAQLAFQLPSLARLGLLPRPRIETRDPGIRRVIERIGPALLGVSAAQISLLLDTLLASFLATGSVSWLYYSDRLMEFPLGILAVAIGTVILPGLSQRHAAQDPKSFSHTLDWALRWILLLGVPAAVGLAALSGPLMATLFYSTQFGIEDVEMAAYSLRAYSLGILGLMGIKVLAPGYYARLDTKTPVRIAIIVLIVDLILSLSLMFPLGHSGLALGTAIAVTLNATLLLRGLLRARILRPEPGWGGLLIKVFVAALTMGGAVSAGTGTAVDWTLMPSGERVLHLAAWIAGGATLYALTLRLLGIRPSVLMRRPPVRETR